MFKLRFALFILLITAPTLALAAADRFALGIGYPDIRERTTLISGLDLEFKVALADQLQGYSSRLYVMPYKTHGLRLGVGGEGGVLSLGGRQGVNGDGFFAGGFAGFDFKWGARWMVNADIGPLWMQLNSQGQTLETVDWVYNTALYFYLF